MPAPRIRFWSIVPLLSVLILAPLLHAQKITVQSADPAFTEQGAQNLNVIIHGKGFKNGARARFLVTGTTNPGGVIVHSTSYVNSTTLVSNVTVEPDAIVSDFDIEVQLSNGRTGKGIEKFVVKEAGSVEIAMALNHQKLGGMDAYGNIEIFAQGETKRYPAWSPCGDRVVYYSDYALFVVPLGGEQPIKVADVNTSTKASWSPDGRWIVYDDAVQDRWVIISHAGGSFQETVLDHDLFFIDMDCADTGGTDCIVQFDTPYIYELSPTWSPFGDELAVKAYLTAEAPTPAELAAYPFSEDSVTSAPLLGVPEILTSGTSLSKLAGDGALFNPDWSKEDGRWIAMDNRATDYSRRISAIDRYTREVFHLTGSYADGNYFGDPSWSPSNNRLVVMATDPSRKNRNGSRTLVFVDVQYDLDGHPIGSTLTYLPRSSKNDYRDPAWRRGVCEQ